MDLKDFHPSGLYVPERVLPADAGRAASGAPALHPPPEDLALGGHHRGRVAAATEVQAHQAVALTVVRGVLGGGVELVLKVRPNLSGRKGGEEIARVRVRVASVRAFLYESIILIICLYYDKKLSFSKKIKNINNPM